MSGILVLAQSRLGEYLMLSANRLGKYTSCAYVAFKSVLQDFVTNKGRLSLPQSPFSTKQPTATAGGKTSEEVGPKVPKSTIA